MNTVPLESTGYTETIVRKECFLEAVVTGPLLTVRRSAQLDEFDVWCKPIYDLVEQTRGRLVHYYSEPDHTMMLGQALVSIYALGDNSDYDYN